MKLRRYMGLIIACGIALVLAVIALIMLIKFNSTYQRVRKDLVSTTSRLNRLYGRDPYPSPENVQMVQSNFTVLQGYFDNLFTLLKKGQINPEKMQRADFPLLLNSTITNLYEQAKRAGVRLPERFTFGFERYTKGALPNPEDVPRLVMQVRTVEQLCDLLFDAKVSDVFSVKRTIFEKGLVESKGESTGRRSGRHRSWDDQNDSEVEDSAKEWVDPSGLFARETYTLEFDASDTAVTSLLNLMGRSPLFLSIAQIELLNDAPLPKVEPLKEEAAAAQTGGIGRTTEGLPISKNNELASTREDRVVAGREKVKITLQLYVYRFLDDSGEKGEDGP